MGVTVRTENFYMDLGYMGFRKIRIKVAELTDKELWMHYKDLEKGMYLSGFARVEFFEQYNKKISSLADKNNIPHGILDFLYESDCSGELSHQKCQPIYEVIKDYDDNILYGYCARSDCATFKDFKNIIQDCVEHKCDLEWY